MIYCYDKRHPLAGFEREMEVASQVGQVVLYDHELDQFVDLEGQGVSIKGEYLLPRTWANTIADIHAEVRRFGGLLLVDDEETERILDWPNYYKPMRKAITLTGEELLQEDVIASLEESLGSEVFIKTKEKNFNGVIPIALLRDTDCVFYKALMEHASESFIVSGKVTILEDEYGKKEYRCFVINGEVANISRFTDDVLHSINPSILARARELASSLKDTMPNSYVVDLFEYEADGERQIDVVEFNPIQGSGIYLYNSAVMVSEDMLHQDLTSLPYETRDKLSECKMSGSVINQREPLYKVPFSFSGDLRSIYLTGSVGVSFTDIPMSPAAWASREPIFGDFFTAIPTDTSLSSDADLSRSGDVKKLIFEPICDFEENE